MSQDDIDAWQQLRFERLGMREKPYNHPGACHRNVMYKQIDDWLGLLDIYMPAKESSTPAPMMIYYHGGGWANGAKENIVVPAHWDYPSIIQKLTGQGIAVVSVDYRLCKFDLTNTVMRDCVVDCKDAFRFMVKNAAEYGLDPERVVIVGGSAGGHLSQMVTLTPPESFPGDPELLPYSVQPLGGISNFGPSDLMNHQSFDLPSEKAYHHRWRNRLFIEGTAPEKIANTEEEISPINYLQADSPPMLFIHGNRDRTISYKQMEVMQKRADELNADMQFVTVNHSGHGWKPEPKDQQIVPSVEEIVSMQADFVARLVGSCR